MYQPALNCQPRIDPTPEEIRKQCWAIQESWTEQVRRVRAGYYADQPYQPELIAAAVMLPEARQADRS